ncbi:hypothetical protein GCM10027061_11490 [Nesterenkonia suensis]
MGAAQRGGLPGAVGAQQDGDLTAAGGEVDAAEDLLHAGRGAGGADGVPDLAQAEAEGLVGHQDILHFYRL